MGNGGGCTTSAMQNILLVRSLYADYGTISTTQESHEDKLFKFYLVLPVFFFCFFYKYVKQKDKSQWYK